MSEELISELGSYAYDPVTFVYWAFPWGVEGTELADEDGPDVWQLWVLQQLKDGIISVEEAILIAVTSGHGIGKSALVAWVVLWAFSTFPGTRGVVTANTENQLKTKTWVEIAKWFRLFLAKDLFSLTATALFAKDDNQAKEWRIDIVPWSERNTEAFAGLHNAGKRILIIYDEASAIPDMIWETSEGALTDKETEIIWACFGNPTKNTGRFRECFGDGKFAHRWKTKEVDSREVKRTNKTQLNKWVEDYGEDSDFCRVRVRGKFPRTDSSSFISRDSAMEAVNRAIPEQNLPLVLGVDVARFGDDFSVIYPRRGRDAMSYPIKIYQGLNTVQFAVRVLEVYYELNAAAIFVDSTGLGAGLFDILRTTHNLPAYEVVFNAGPDGTNKTDPNIGYANKRAEIWGGMRDFLKTGAIPDMIPGTDKSLVKELTTPSYSFTNKNKILLESKELIKRRGEPSPDIADALACTFAFPVSANPLATMSRPNVKRNYDPFEESRLVVSNA